jgi:hypothetical protein
VGDDRGATRGLECGRSTAQSGRFIGVSDPEQRGASTLELLKEVTAHMREFGVKRVWIARGPLELEVELDPASQFVGAGKDEGQTDAEAEKEREEKRAKGLCVSRGCSAPAGHLGSPHCRQHFLAEMNGVETA